MSKLSLWLSLSLTLSFLLCSCRENYQTSVPTYPVHLDINIAAEYPHFVLGNGGPQFLVFTEKRYATDYIGFAGIIVSISCDARYYAHDMACPKCQNRQRPVELDGFFAICPCCGEQYDLSYGIGNPMKGICKEPLRRYSVVYSSYSNILSIRQGQ